MTEDEFDGSVRKYFCAIVAAGAPRGATMLHILGNSASEVERRFGQIKALQIVGISPYRAEWRC
jgi:hypothetical protein